MITGDSHVPTGSATSSEERPIFLDLWRTNLGPEGGAAPYTQGPAWGYNNTCPRLPEQSERPGECLVLGECTALGKYGDHDYGGYEDALFEREVLRTVKEHDVAYPYFMFWAPHIAHVPLEVPKVYYDRFADLEGGDVDRHSRQIYEAMTSFADTAILNLTLALKAKANKHTAQSDTHTAGVVVSMWDETVFVFTSDNGGPISDNGTSGANNWPLKGGKGTQWEG